MGDRANIYVETEDTVGTRAGIYLYTHWSGWRWPEALREALEFGRSRWNDPTYLSRIIASRVFLDIHDQTEGGGLSLCLTDNGYPIIVCDLDNLEVSFAKGGSETDVNARTDRMTFEQYIKQTEAHYPA